MPEVGKPADYLVLEGSGQLTRVEATIAYVYPDGTTCDLLLVRLGEPLPSVPEIDTARQIAYCSGGDEPGMWTDPE